MINNQLQPTQKCLVCGDQARPKTNFCSDACVEYYITELSYRKNLELMQQIIAKKKEC